MGEAAFLIAGFLVAVVSLPSQTSVTFCWSAGRRVSKPKRVSFAEVEYLCCFVFFGGGEGERGKRLKERMFDCLLLFLSFFLLCSSFTHLFFFVFFFFVFFFFFTLKHIK